MQDYRKLFDLSGKAAVVIGAAFGIGRASAEAIASLGARVICADADAASYISGSSLSVDGGWTAIDGPPNGLTATRPSQ